MTLDPDAPVRSAVDPALASSVDDAVAGPLAGGLLGPSFDATRVLGADPHDFAGLYVRHRTHFAAQARRFLRDPRDVDEVVQEAFLRLFLVLPELPSEAQAMAYCRRTVTNLCIDRYRADQRRPRLVDFDSLSTDALVDDEPDDPVVQAEDAAVVRRALAQLTPLHRSALIKREVEEKPLPVIAAELAVPEESVKHILHRARRALRRLLSATTVAPGADSERPSTATLLASAITHSGGKLTGVVLVVAVLLGGVAELDVLRTVAWTPERLIAIVTGDPPPQLPPAGRDAGGTGPGAPPDTSAPAGPGGVVPPGAPVIGDLPLPAAATSTVSASPAPAATRTVGVAPPAGPVPAASPNATSTPGAAPGAGDSAGSSSAEAEATPGPSADPSAAAPSGRGEAEPDVAEPPRGRHRSPAGQDGDRRASRPGRDRSGGAHSRPFIPAPPPGSQDSPDALPPDFELSPPAGTLPPVDDESGQLTDVPVRSPVPQ